MSQKLIERISRLDQLIRLKSTGTPKELANRLEISESTLYETISMMKQLGAPINYDKLRKSYYYQAEGKIEIKFIKK
ncbi:HTH domain-containing protein [Belliella sp. DSM 107340]|uniref:HTH domain-containing protein n=1 Tax=Belliella calami TaxID=2923436 RepID=A0ABS9UQX0_9BACT|nr:HTH domain-containing protein [Belliella calami]MCH7399021.1 HTH domain-containing protein [Belliella calami]